MFLTILHVASLIQLSAETLWLQLKTFKVKLAQWGTAPDPTIHHSEETEENDNSGNLASILFINLGVLEMPQFRAI